jgi:GNAT superfamily N-acetyltransferase
MTSKFELTTRSGIALDVRAATVSDEATLSDFFDRVSQADRRFRFFTSAKHVSDEQLHPLIHADHIHSESYLAFDQANGELVASAMLACDATFETAEIAVSICSDYKGKGVGWALLDFLCQEAERRGVRSVISIESRANQATIELERENGFTVEPFEGDSTLVVLSKAFR